VLGDYWRGHSESISSTALVAILREFGVGHAGARSALSRLTKRQLLRRTRAGRQTFYQLTDRALAEIDAGAQRIFSFGADDPPWDGYWSLVAFTISEPERQRRQLLRNHLRWLGFGPLYDGLWVSPHPRLDAVGAKLKELGVPTVTLFRAKAVDGWSPNVKAIWSLESLAGAYSDFSRRLRSIQDRMMDGTLTSSESLVARTLAMDSWRRFPREDPDLPSQLLPRKWSRADARARFLAVHDGLKPMADSRVGEILLEQ
jgi:phenylacetic acid degradation operon negative regulatory protein